MSIDIPNQKTFFYNGKWTPKTDNLLLSNIIRMRGARPWQGNTIPDSVVLEAAAAINQEIGGQLTVTDLNIWLKVLRERYTTFNQLVTTKGVYWDIPYHVVLAAEEVWKKIFQRNAFAGAYYHRDEPAFNQLATMFGLSDIKVEDEPEVIVISDTTEVVEHGLGKNAYSPTDTEEVTSPNTCITPRVRRKLFTEATTSKEDRKSSNVAPAYYPVSCNKGGLMLKVENQAPCHSIPPTKSVPKSSPNASSSASWSPFGRDWKPTS
ncbi:hypothetical protein AAHA92_06533 [Salvia divinorum]|uniref:Myb/SANT-like domain-containing protein n=1 Tax=Salvia divinorum TaxID=28513 RepID=A0ABD1I5Z5_SALDI